MTKHALTRATAEARRQAAESNARQFAVLLQREHLPCPVREHAFAAPARQWRADFAWPALRVILEVEGGIFTGGRHTRGAGFLRDMEKYNAAQLKGWMVLRTTPTDLVTLATVAMLRAAFEVQTTRQAALELAEVEP